MAFSHWEMIGELTYIPETDETFLILDGNSNRIIIEKFDSEEGRSSPKSKFFHVKAVKIMTSEEATRLMINLDDEDFAKELKE